MSALVSNYTFTHTDASTQVSTQYAHHRHIHIYNEIIKFINTEMKGEALQQTLRKFRDT